MPPKKKTEVTEERTPETTETTETGTPEVTPAAPIEASVISTPETPPEVVSEPPIQPVEAATDPEPAQTPPPEERSIFDVLGDRLEQAAEAIAVEVEEVVKEIPHPDFPNAEEFFHRWHGIKVK